MGGRIMYTLDEIITRARGFIGSVEHIDEDNLTKLLSAVYSDGLRHEREECAKLCDGKANKAATLRLSDTESEAGLKIQAGRRLVAIELAGEIRGRGQVKEDDRPVGNKRRRAQ